MRAEGFSGFHLKTTQNIPQMKYNLNYSSVYLSSYFSLNSTGWKMLMLNEDDVEQNVNETLLKVRRTKTLLVVIQHLKCTVLKTVLDICKYSK